MMTLAADLEQVWNAPDADMRFKQRVVPSVIHEVIVDIDSASEQIVLRIHWKGGRHSELRVVRARSGDHKHATGVEALEVVRRMAGEWSDSDIAGTLNGLKLKTGNGNTWTESRVHLL